ncbi:hypothetical protein N2152v2_000265 [Parachlorella kessleri]
MATRFRTPPLQASCRLQLSRVWATSEHRRTAPSIARRRLLPTAAGQQGSWEEEKDNKEASSSSKSSSSASRLTGSSQKRVAAILASVGLDPAELQQQRAEDYSRLTLPLAQVLAEVHAARVAKAVGTLKVQPAVLMARICFLAYESSPALFAIPVTTLQRNLQGLLSRCPMNEQQLRAFVRGQYTLLWLDYECVLSKLDSLLAELPGLKQGVAKLLVYGGSLLSLSWESLSTKLAYLKTYGFAEGQLTRTVLQDGKMLTYSLDGKLQPVLAALEGVLGGRQAVVEAVSKCAPLLGMSLSTLDGNVEYLKELGLSESEIRDSVSRQPQLFCRDYTSPVLQDKFEVVLGRCPRDMFLHFPTYLLSGLHKIDYRASFLERKGDPRVRTTLSWIICSDNVLCQKYRYSLEEFAGWEEEWVQSKRAKEYGLDTPAERGFKRAQAARDRGRRASVAARRQQVLDSGEVG